MFENKKFTCISRSRIFFSNSILRIQDLYMPKINQLVTIDASPYEVGGVLYHRLLAWKHLHFLLPACTHNLLTLSRTQWNENNILVKFYCMAESKWQGNCNINKVQYGHFCKTSSKSECKLLLLLTNNFTSSEVHDLLRVSMNGNGTCHGTRSSILTTSWLMRTFSTEITRLLNQVYKIQNRTVNCEWYPEETWLELTKWVLESEERGQENMCL
jgi:hypothetical protein